LAEGLIKNKPPPDSPPNSGGGGQEEGWFRSTPLRASDLSEDEKTTAAVASRTPDEHTSAAADISTLWSAEEVWVSPLTRTIQTALVALQGHPTLRNKGFTLVSDAREIKGIGGLDSIGVAKGADNIRSRVEGEFLDLYSHKAALSDDPMYTPARIVDSLLSPKLDAGDALDEWWTSAFNKDKTEDVDVRLNELLNSIKFSQSSSLVLVSHSNLFRALLGRRVANTLRDRSPELCKEAADHKMRNCAVIRLEIDFSLDLTQCITELIPLFCDEFGVFESKEKAMLEKSRHSASRSRHASSPPRSSAPASTLSETEGTSSFGRSQSSFTLQGNSGGGSGPQGSMMKKASSLNDRNGRYNGGTQSLRINKINLSSGLAQVQEETLRNESLSSSSNPSFALSPNPNSNPNPNLPPSQHTSVQPNSSTSSVNSNEMSTNDSTSITSTGGGGVGNVTESDHMKKPPAGQFTKSSLPLNLPSHNEQIVDVSFPSPTLSSRQGNEGNEDGSAELSKILMPNVVAQSSATTTLNQSATGINNGMRSVSSSTQGDGDDGSIDMGFGNIYGGRGGDGNEDKQSKKKDKKKDKKKTRNSVNSQGSRDGALSTSSSSNSLDNFSGDNPFSRLSMASDDNPLRRMSQTLSDQSER